MPTVQVIWSTFRPLASTEDDISRVRSVVFDIADMTSSDLELCERLYRDTNFYNGPLWDAMQPLPEDRTHTSLSVGDYVRIDDRMYRCATIGWEATEEFIPGLSFMDVLPEARPVISR